MTFPQDSWFSIADFVLGLELDLLDQNAIGELSQLLVSLNNIGHYGSWKGNIA